MACNLAAELKLLMLTFSDPRQTIYGSYTLHAISFSIYKVIKRCTPGWKSFFTWFFSLSLIHNLLTTHAIASILYLHPSKKITQKEDFPGTYSVIVLPEGWYSGKYPQREFVKSWWRKPPASLDNETEAITDTGHLHGDRCPCFIVSGFIVLDRLSFHICYNTHMCKAGVLSCGINAHDREQHIATLNRHCYITPNKSMSKSMN